MAFHSPSLKLGYLLRIGRICEPCARRLFRHTELCTNFRRSHHASHISSAAAQSSQARFGLGGKYFWANDIFATDHSPQQIPRSSPEPIVEDTTEPLVPSLEDSPTGLPENGLPLGHRDPSYARRRRKRQRSNNDLDGPQTIPPDASSQLSSLSSKLPSRSLRQSTTALLSLSKPRLTFLMVLTTASAYTLFPVAISPFSSSMSLSPLTLLNLTAGTTLSSACANALNMLLEPTHDAKMTRTRTRPLPRGLISSRAALLFAAASGLSGVALLHYGVNPTVAFLSAANILIYAGIYTPMKRLSIINTWIGAVVGGIPPLMGWAAAAGQASPFLNPSWQDLLFSPETSAGGWLLAALLFSWQFPHFNAIAYTIRHEYAGAGYRMLASVNARKNALIALRYSLAMFPVCVGLSAVGVTSWAFVGTSGVVNAWMTREAWRFWRWEGGGGSARALFWASVWHLPLVLVLAMVQKKGLWERFMQGGMDEEELRAWQEEGERTKDLHV